MLDSVASGTGETFTVVLNSSLLELELGGKEMVEDPPIDPGVDEVDGKGASATEELDEALVTVVEIVANGVVVVVENSVVVVVGKGVVVTS